MALIYNTLLYEYNSLYKGMLDYIPPSSMPLISTPNSTPIHSQTQARSESRTREVDKTQEPPKGLKSRDDLVEYVNTLYEREKVIYTNDEGYTDVLLYNIKPDVELEGLPQNIIVKRIHRKMLISTGISRLTRDIILSEGYKISALNSPYVVRCYGQDNDDTYLYLYLEYIQGDTLYDYINLKLKEGISIPPMKVFYICLQLANGLRDMHTENIVHKDIKLENIMIIDKGSMPILKYIDLGYALDLKDILRHVGTGNVLGCDPHLVRQQEASDEEYKLADIYGLGILFYVIMSRQQPFEYDPKDTDIVYKVLRLKRLNKYNVLCSGYEAFDDLVHSMLQYEPIRRPSLNTIISTLMKLIGQTNPIY